MWPAGAIRAKPVNAAPTLVVRVLVRDVNLGSDIINVS
jgi:hypothetical protein